MSKSKIADKYLERTRFFAATRKPGRFSPKSGLIFIKAGPKFTHLTPQQEKVSAAGEFCGAAVKGHFEGSANVKTRRNAMAACIRSQFGKKQLPGDKKLLEEMGID